MKIKKSNALPLVSETRSFKEEDQLVDNDEFGKDLNRHIAVIRNVVRESSENA
ncbi:MAG: hypothetical protein U0694_17505 [Anaerolineae bacterium]